MPATVEVRETSPTLPSEFQSSVRRNLLSKQELASALGVSPRTIETWMAQKRIPFLRLSSRFVKFNLDRVLAALNRYEVREVGAAR